MARIGLTLHVRFAWWWRYMCAPGILWLHSTFGLDVNEDRFAYWTKKAMKISSTETI